MEIVMTVISKMSDFYERNGDLINGDRAITEMEKIEKQYEAAHEAALDYLDSRKDDASSCLSNPASIDLVQRINLSRGQEETYETENQGLSSEVMPSFLYDQYSPPVRMPNTTDSINTNKHASHDRTNEIVGNWSRNSNGDHCVDNQQEEKGTSRQRSGKGAIRKRFPLQKPRSTCIHYESRRSWQTRLFKYIRRACCTTDRRCGLHV